MSKCKTLKEIFKTFAAASSLSNASLILSDAAGNGMRGKVSSFAMRAEIEANVGSVLRISRLKSVLVSVRGSNGGRCALVWFSSYANGTRARTSFARIFNSDANYKWYINGDSDESARVYLSLTGSSSTDVVSVVSLAGEVPDIREVDAVPSDATLINWGGVNYYHSISYTNTPKGGGLRDVEEQENYQRNPDGKTTKCDGRQRILLRCQRNHPNRSISSGRKHSKQANERVRNGISFPLTRTNMYDPTLHWLYRLVSDNLYMREDMVGRQLAPLGTGDHHSHYLAPERRAAA